MKFVSLLLLIYNVNSEYFIYSGGGIGGSATAVRGASEYDFSFLVDKCGEMGLSPARIESAQENIDAAAACQAAGGAPCWIDLVRDDYTDPSPKWYWRDDGGYTGQSLAFTDWDGNEGAAAGSEACVCLYNGANFKWHDVGCTHGPHKLLCQSTDSEVSVANACFDAKNVQPEAFTAPQSGTISGIRLANPVNLVTCSGTPHSNWGCGDTLMGVALIGSNDGGTTWTQYYPTTATDDVTKDSRGCPTPCATNAWSWYTMGQSNGYSDEIVFDQPSYDITTDTKFKLVYGEACCQYAPGDNAGEACADVYFQYEETITSDPTKAPTPSPITLPYVPGSGSMTFSSAQQYCYNEHGSSLATIISRDDYDEAIETLNEAGVTTGEAWVGMSDTNDEGKWFWQDGTLCDYATDDLCINDDNWKDGNPVRDDSSVDECGLYELSTSYGGTGGGYAEARKQGRINGISSWGYGGTYGGLNNPVIKTWSADNQNSNAVFGARTDYTPCTAFTLDSDDAINGYTIWTGDGDLTDGQDYVHGLEFNTYKGNSYRCVNQGDVDNNLHELTDTYSCGNCVLTGFVMMVGDIIDKIQFEFAYPCYSNDCSALDVEGSYGSFLSDESCDIKKPFLCNLDDSMEGKQCSSPPDTFDWDSLTESGTNIPELNWDPDNVELSIDVDPPHLAISIHAELEYIGSVSADDQKQANFGFTYVLDFEDYNAHEDDIFYPGTCQNRRHESFLTSDGSTIRDFNEWWYYSEHPNLNNEHLGAGSYLAYPPPHPHVGDWDISMKDDDDCNTVVYDGYFTWEDLRNCGSDKNGDGVKDGAPYTIVGYSTHENGRRYIDLSGTFYINAVSPYWHDKDYGFYRVYQLLSQPFVISVATSVEVLGSAGINLMTICVIAVYKEGTDNNDNVKTGEDIFRLIVLTESAEYLALSNADLFHYDGVYAGDLEAVSDSVNGNCLGNKNYICSQLWEIRAENVVCSGKEVDPDNNDENTLSGGIDFSGDYTLSFDTGCISDHPDEVYCGTWLDDHSDIKDGVKLTATLSWHDYICDAILFEVQFGAAMSFYKEDLDGNVDWINALVQDDDGTTNHLYQVGSDTVYVEINSNFPSETYHIFDTTLLDVYICTFAPGSDTGDVTEYQNTGTTGCLSDNRDEKFDDKFHHIFSTTATIIKAHSFDELDTDGQDDDDNAEIRFKFVVPNEVQRDTLYVHAFIEVTLVELETGRRRLQRVLLGSAMAEGTANQIGNEIGSVGIVNQNKPKDNPQPPQDNNNNNIPDNNNKPQPIDDVNNNPFTLSLNTPWILAIGGLLGLILIFNVVMLCYMNCNKEQRRSVSWSSARRSGYASVKHIDSSEFDDSEAKAINVVSSDDDPSVLSQ